MRYQLIYFFVFLTFVNSAFADSEISPECLDDLENCCCDTSFLNNPLYLGSTEIGFYGFIKLEGLLVDRLTGNFPEVFPQKVPLNTDRADHHSQTIIDARSSRFGAKALDEFFGVKTTAVIEGDFFDTYGNSITFNSRAFRLRLAYAKAELPTGFFILAGQYWTLPMNIPDIPDPLFVNTQNAPVGVALARQPQLRFGYKYQLNEDALVKFEADIEKHAFNNLGYVTPEGDDPLEGGEQLWPLFSAKLSYLGNNFKASLGGSASQERYVLNALGDTKKRNIWAVCAIASYKWDNLQVWGTLNHSVGLSSMFSGWFNNAAISRNDAFFAFNSSGGCLACRYDWIPDVLISDIVYGMQRGNKIPDTVFSRDTLKSLKDFRVNLFYKFWGNWQAGIEYQFVKVLSFNDKKGMAQDIHAAIWYNFGQPIEFSH